jgi:glycosyltransferase involved in cell wall biosynthesis
MGATQQSGLSWDRVWIAIPAFNESGTIRMLVRKALTYCPRVIVVDDGSTDGTAAQLRDLPVTLLTHNANRGKAAALRTALAYALVQRHSA